MLTVYYYHPLSACTFQSETMPPVTEIVCVSERDDASCDGNCLCFRERRCLLWRRLSVFHRETMPLVTEIVCVSERDDASVTEIVCVSEQDDASCDGDCLCFRARVCLLWRRLSVFQSKTMPELYELVNITGRTWSGLTGIGKPRTPSGTLQTLSPGFTTTGEAGRREYLIDLSLHLVKMYVNDIHS